MGWFLIGGVILIGLFLIMVEFFFIPGTTIVGLIGALFVVTGISVAYLSHGVAAGTATLVVSGGASVAIVMLSLKLVSGRLSLKETISGKVSMSENEGVTEGDEGNTFTYLRPNGKAIINGKKVDVYSLGEYVESNIPVRVVKIIENKIFVKPINKS